MPEKHLSAIARAAVSGSAGAVDALDATRALRDLQRRCAASDGSAPVTLAEVAGLLSLVERLTARVAEPAAVAAAIRSRFDALRMGGDSQLVSHLAGQFSAPGSAHGSETPGHRSGTEPTALMSAPASAAVAARETSDAAGAAAAAEAAGGTASPGDDVADVTGTTVSGPTRRPSSARLAVRVSAATAPAGTGPSAESVAAAKTVLAAARGAAAVLEAVPAARAIVASAAAPAPPLASPTAAPSDVVVALLTELTSWNFDVFSLAAARPHAVIETVAWAALMRHGLPAALGLDGSRVRAWLRAVEDGYTDPPYHNRVHGADVTQTTFWFTWGGGAGSGGGGMRHWLSNEETLALVLGAAAHDTGHFGRNNPFLVATGHPLALRYNDRSPLESMHAARAFELMQDERMDWLAALPATQRKAVRRDMTSIILATDNAEHFAQLGALAQKVAAARARLELTADAEAADGGEAGGARRGPVLDLESDASARLLVKGLALHAADVSNPAKRFSTAAVWADRVRAEFYEQGDDERERGLPIAPGFDRRSEIPMGKFQLGFIKAIVQPLYAQLQDANCADVDESSPWFTVSTPLDHLAKNVDLWQARLESEAASAPAPASAAPPSPPKRA